MSYDPSKSTEVVMERHQKDLISCLGGVKDPRIERTKKHKLIDILVITVCAHLCSADNWVEVSVNLPAP